MSTESLAIAVVLLLAVSAALVVPTKKEREMEARVVQLESAKNCQENDDGRTANRAGLAHCDIIASAK